MKIHTLFFVRHYPSAWYFRDTDYFMAEVDDVLRETMFDRLGSYGPERQFFAKGKSPLAGIAVRSEGVSETLALAMARDTADAFVDALSLMAYNQQPDISKLVLVASPTDANARVLLFSPESFVELSAAAPAMQLSKDARADQITSMLVPLFDLASGNHQRSGSALAEQLAYALKMFRYGSCAGAYAIEFVCKFTAMESLVCGGQPGSKRANLVSRLGRLFPKDPRLTPTYLNELWDVRNAAVHEARGFHREMATNSARVQSHLENLNRIVFSVVTYAAVHLDRADSVQALWSSPAGYQLPDFTQAFRPQTPGAFRFEGRRIAMNLNVVLPNAQMIFRPFLDSADGAPAAGKVPSDD